MVTTTEQSTTGTFAASPIFPGSSSPFEFPSVEDITRRINELNERFLKSSKSAGLVMLDTFEKAVQTIGDLEQKVASTTQQEWVVTAAASHTKLMTDASGAYAGAVRDLLK